MRAWHVLRINPRFAAVMCVNLERACGAGDDAGFIEENRMSTVFEKLLSGEWRCAKVYEDEHVFAFMDAGQVNDGHVIVATKLPHETLLDCSGADRGVAVRRMRCTTLQYITDRSRHAIRIEGQSGQPAPAQ